jgi:hypothetical protein
VTIEQRVWDWLALNGPARLRHAKRAFAEYTGRTVASAVERLRKGDYLALDEDGRYSVPPSTPRPRDGRGSH